MGEMITKPDANPILLAVLNLFWAFLGYYLMGQKKKAIMSLIIGIVLMPCMGIGGIWMAIAAYDAYLLGQKLASGESIGQMENGLGFLDNIFKS